MTKDEFIKIIEDEYIEVDKLCDLIIKLEDIKLDITISSLPNKKWHCKIIEDNPKVLISCNAYNEYLRDAVISCICKKFNIGD